DGGTRDNPNEVEVVLGGVAELPCHLSPGYQPMLILWYRVDIGTPVFSYDARNPLQPRQWSARRALGGTLTLKLDPKLEDIDNALSPVMSTSSSLSANLVIEGAHDTDKGIYRCRVDYRGRPTQDTYTSLAVIVPPEAPVIEILSEGHWLKKDRDAYIGPLRVGSKLSLRCTARGGEPAPKVSWWRGGQKLLGTTSEIVVNENGAVISKVEVVVRPEDERTPIVCQAANTVMVPPLRTALLMTILVPPSWVRVVGGSRPMSADKSYAVECHSAGAEPPPVLSWWLAGDQLIASGQRTSINGSTVSYLEFTPKAVHSGAHLMCKAIPPDHLIAEMDPQTSWVLTDSVPLKITYKPEAQLMIRHMKREGSSLGATDRVGVALPPATPLGTDGDVDVHEGDGVVMHCDVRADPPVFHVAWQKDGLPLTGEPHNPGVKVGNMSVIIIKTTRNHMGTYTCTAHNNEGSSKSRETFLGIIHGPECGRSRPEIVGAPRDHEINVTCEVSAYPMPVAWSWAVRSVRGLVPLPRHMVHHQANISWVTYTPRSRVDYGELLCWATSAAGRQQDPCSSRLVVADQPITPRDCSVRNHIPQALFITCTAPLDQALPTTLHAHVYNPKGDRIQESSSASKKITIRSLNPSQQYRIVIWAANTYGISRSIELFANTSAATANATITTHSLNGHHPEDDRHVFSHFGSSLLAVLLVVTVLVVMIGIVVGLITNEWLVGPDMSAHHPQEDEYLTPKYSGKDEDDGPCISVEDIENSSIQLSSSDEETEQDSPVYAVPHNQLGNKSSSKSYMTPSFTTFSQNETLLHDGTPTSWNLPMSNSRLFRNNIEVHQIKQKQSNKKFQPNKTPNFPITKIPMPERLSSSKHFTGSNITPHSKQTKISTVPSKQPKFPVTKSIISHQNSNLERCYDEGGDEEKDNDENSYRVILMPETNKKLKKAKDKGSQLLIDLTEKGFFDELHCGEPTLTTNFSRKCAFITNGETTALWFQESSKFLQTQGNQQLFSRNFNVDNNLGDKTNFISNIEPIYEPVKNISFKDRGYCDMILPEKAAGNAPCFLKPSNNLKPKITKPRLPPPKVPPPKVPPPKIPDVNSTQAESKFRSPYPSITPPKDPPPKIPTMKLCYPNVSSPKINGPKFLGPKVLPPRVPPPSVPPPKIPTTTTESMHAQYMSQQSKISDKINPIEVHPSKIQLPKMAPHVHSPPNSQPTKVQLSNQPLVNNPKPNVKSNNNQIGKIKRIAPKVPPPEIPTTTTSFSDNIGLTSFNSDEFLLDATVGSKSSVSQPFPREITEEVVKCEEDIVKQFPNLLTQPSDLLRQYQILNPPKEKIQHHVHWGTMSDIKESNKSKKNYSCKGSEAVKALIHQESTLGRDYTPPTDSFSRNEEDGFVAMSCEILKSPTVFRHTSSPVPTPSPRLGNRHDSVSASTSSLDNYCTERIEKKMKMRLSPQRRPRSIHVACGAQRAPVVVYSTDISILSRSYSWSSFASSCAPSSSSSSHLPNSSQSSYSRSLSSGDFYSVDSTVFPSSSSHTSSGSLVSSSSSFLSSMTEESVSMSLQSFSASPSLSSCSTSNYSVSFDLFKPS
ncbi:unnamed protein product, partial [Meganyctiphanes norvegica]